MTKLERLRKQYGVPAKRGGRVSFYSVWEKDYVSGTIRGATTSGYLVVHTDGWPSCDEVFVNPLDVRFLDSPK